MEHSDFEIVVARYTEPLTWIDQVPIDMKITVYNKGSLRENIERVTEISLNNVGRESDTYLRHIVLNYDGLADATLFVQARINDRKDQQTLNIDEFIRVAEWGGPDLFVATLRVMADPYNWGHEVESYGGISAFQMPLGEFQEKHLGISHNRFSFFVPGACFLVGRNLIRRHPRRFYERLLETEIGSHINPIFGHYMERSWFRIFHGT